MNRIISILLLALITAVSVRPVLALHFCGGKLHSVHYGKYLSEMSCCQTKPKQATGHTDKRDVVPQNVYYQAVNACCANCGLALSADDFRLQQKTATVILPLVSFLSYLFPELTPSCDDGFSLSHNLPPGNRALLPADRLTRFCIFRI
ncbi:MAG: hypothetical protein LBF89_10805 [Bacteroidales bacterium]|jgi:hypothetical protein|nr:hypothetical protein [Bacteroidales bacterium]